MQTCDIKQGHIPEESTDVTKIIVDEFNIAMETIGGDASWLNGNIGKTIKPFITWLEKVFCTVKNMKTNGIVQNKNNLKYIYVNYIVH